MLLYKQLLLITFGNTLVNPLIISVRTYYFPTIVSCKHIFNNIYAMDFKSP